MKNADLPLLIARAAPLIIRHDGTTEPFVCPPPHNENLQEAQASLTALQAAAGRYIEAVAVPADESLVLVVNEDGLMLNLPPNPQASALALRSIVGDAVLLSRALLYA